MVPAERGHCVLAALNLKAYFLAVQIHDVHVSILSSHSTVGTKLVRGQANNWVLANLNDLLALLVVVAEQRDVAVIEAHYELVLLVVQPLAACCDLAVRVVGCPERLGLLVLGCILPYSYLVFS